MLITPPRPVPTSCQRISYGGFEAWAATSKSPCAGSTASRWMAAAWTQLHDEFRALRHPATLPISSPFSKPRRRSRRHFRATDRNPWVRHASPWISTRLHPTQAPRCSSILRKAAAFPSSGLLQRLSGARDDDHLIEPAAQGVEIAARVDPRLLLCGQREPAQREHVTEARASLLDVPLDRPRSARPSIRGAAAASPGTPRARRTRWSPTSRASRRATPCSPG